MTELTVVSSHGTLTIDGEGRVHHFEPNETGDPKDIKHLNSITRFDLREWCRHHDGFTFPHRFDILDLGYWYKNVREQEVKYVPADKDWRKTVAEQKEASNG